MNAHLSSSHSPHDQRITAQAQTLLAQMTLNEKIGQMNQVHACDGFAPDYLGDEVRAGAIGSVINVEDPAAIRELQRLAVEESRLGIPLLVGRDVIHGFRTILPIPLGQAASWNPLLIERGAQVAASEAATVGINWTFSPMVDLARDPRWGRIAESFGEDVFLNQCCTRAMVEGYQGNNLTDAGSIAACVKHFAGYGAVESGRDYATTLVPELELRSVYLPPFQAGVDAGALSVMTSFSDLNGVPATGNAFLLRNVLREEWQFDGITLSDWDSVRQLTIHGVAENERDAAQQAVVAGVDMEMEGRSFLRHLESLANDGQVEIERIDEAVLNILSVKLKLGLFEQPYARRDELPPVLDGHALNVAQELATQSAVLLKNDEALLPLNSAKPLKVAVLGPLADAPYEQLGTWIFDGDANDSVTPLMTLRDRSNLALAVEPVFAHSRDRDRSRFDAAAECAASSDVALLFLGEESILSGEAHCRANIDLPGAQAELVARLRQTQTPLVAVVMAGRPLTLSNILGNVDALLYAWHPGTMAGPALVDLLFGEAVPSGKLPATLPLMVGQIPIYYNQKNTGKPPSPETVVHIDDIDTFAPQTSLGMTAFHLDAGYRPLFPFGFGLSYTTFDYSDTWVSAQQIAVDDSITVSSTVTNSGGREAEEVVQLYLRDKVGTVTRPVKELKGFQRVRLRPGEALEVSFVITPEARRFVGRQMVEEPGVGEFAVAIGGHSDVTLNTTFYVHPGSFD
ncbi:MAG: glycoside hydrolase family 3 N-terminal domain-containing protein [Pseudomonadota bacterium]